MCRIKNEPYKYEFIKEERAKILEGGSVSIIVEDPIEGNTTFNVSIEEDDGKDGVTRVERIDSKKVEVKIINPNLSAVVAPNEPMEIGSYMQNKKLYMDYKLYKKYDDEAYREINIEFGTDKKE